MEVFELHAPELAVTLGWKESDAFYGLAKLFKWALARCPDDAPPSTNDIIYGPLAPRLLAAAAGWDGDPEAFVTALEHLTPDAVVQRLPDGIRICGLKRYDAAWGKSHPEQWRTRNGLVPEPARNRTGTGASPKRNRTNSGPEPVPQTQTQTQIQEEALEALSVSPTQSLSLFDSLSPTDPNLSVTQVVKNPETERPSPRPEADSPGETPEALLAEWNNADLPKWRELNASRRTKAKARLRERPLSEWREVIERIARSSFCRGQNDRGWRASPDWLLQPDTAAKVLEGKYDDRPTPGAKRADDGIRSTAPPEEPCGRCGDEERYRSKVWSQVLCTPCRVDWDAEVYAQVPQAEQTGPELNRRTAAWVAAKRSSQEVRP
jgi:hypothetical protein